MVTMQGDTAIAIRGPRKERPRKLPVELFGTVRPPFGLSEYHQRNRGVKLVLEEALMGCGVVEVNKRLVGLLELQRRGRQRTLMIVKTEVVHSVQYHSFTLSLSFDIYR